MKKKIVMSLALVLAIGVVTGCGCGKKNNSKKDEKAPVVKTNTEEEVVKDRVVDGIKLTNTSLTTTNGISQLITSVTNDSDQDYRLEEFRIIVKDADGKEIANLPGFVGDVIKAGETRTIDSSVDLDLSKAKSVEYEVKK